MPTAKKESFTSETARCRTSGNISRLNDERAIVLGPVESKVVTGSCLPITGPVRFFGVVSIYILQGNLSYPKIEVTRASYPKITAVLQSVTAKRVTG